MYDYLEWLIVRFDLNDCEAGDLCAFVDVHDSLSREHARMRAEVLELVGSEMQEMYDDMEKLTS